MVQCEEEGLDAGWDVTPPPRQMVQCEEEGLDAGRDVTPISPGRWCSVRRRVWMPAVTSLPPPPADGAM